MDKNIKEGESVGLGLREALTLEVEKRKKEPKLFLYDIITFFLSFVFSRYHLVFGIYPLGISFVAASTKRVWIALIASVFGSLSLGKAGVIHALVTAIVVFLRVVISGGKRKDASALAFSEPIAFRMAAALIGSVISAAYILLLEGFSLSGLVSALIAAILYVVITLIFSGLFVADIGFDEIVFAKAPVFEVKRKSKAQYSFICFQVSFLFLLFFLSLALKEYKLLGIDAVFVFSAFITLFAAKRFGAIRAMTIGFVSSLGVSALYSPAFALLGAFSGLFFKINSLYAVFFGGAALSAWSAYTGGLVGFLSVFPEFAAAAALFFPLIKNLEGERKAEVREDGKRKAGDFIASLSLSRRNEEKGGTAKLSSAFSYLSSLLLRFGKNEGKTSQLDVESAVLGAVREACGSCSFFEICKAINPAPCAEIVSELSTIIYKNNKISPSDVKTFPDYCENRRLLFEKISKEVGEVYREKYKSVRLSELAREYETVAKLVNEASFSEESAWLLDKALSDKLEALVFELGLADGAVKVFGERKKRIVIAGEDERGEIIGKPEFKRAIEEAAGMRLSVPEFYKREKIALFEAQRAPEYSVEYAAESLIAENSEVSGDTEGSVSLDDGYFYSLISDGMGTGELAREASCFVRDFVFNALTSGVSETAALNTLNSILRMRDNECSATLDLLRFDLFSGEAMFLKSGAVASFVKRGDSIFKIRSESAPLGLMKNVDAERIRMEIKAGDMVVMFSDGVLDSPDSAVFISEILSKDFEGSVSEYADFILKETKRRTTLRDDATVSVAKIRKIS